MPLTFQSVKDVLPLNDQTQAEVVRLLSAVGAGYGKVEDDTEIHPADAILMVVGGWMRLVLHLYSDQVQMAFYQMYPALRPQLEITWEQLERGESKFHSVYVSILDGRYATWTTHGKLLDLDTGSTLDDLQKPHIYTAAMDLAAVAGLFLQKKEHDARKKEQQGTVG